MKNALEQLSAMTVIVADTGDASMVRLHKPQDCTTNPSLVLAALNSPDAQDLISAEIETARGKAINAAALCDTLTVAIGAKLAALVPGRVSTEVDARLSFDVDVPLTLTMAYKGGIDPECPDEDQAQRPHKIEVKPAFRDEFQPEPRIDKHGNHGACEGHCEGLCGRDQKGGHHIVAHQCLCRCMAGP